MILIEIFRPEEYKKKVAEYVKKYATEEALRADRGEEGLSHFFNFSSNIKMLC